MRGRGKGGEDRPGTSMNPISSCKSFKDSINSVSILSEAGKQKVPTGCSSSLSILYLKEMRQRSQGSPGHIEEEMIHAEKVPPPPVTQV